MIRDSSGQVIATRSSLHGNVSTAFAAEDLAAVVAMKTANELGLQKVVLEEDSLSVIKKCTQAQQDSSEICACITDVKNYGKFLQEVRFNH